jgi:hypothetical protein
MADVTCPGCGDQTRNATCCNHRCDGQWGTGCFHCHHPRFWVLELARREETYYSNRSPTGWPMRSCVVPNYADLITGRIAAVEFEVACGDGIHLAAAMRAAGYLVDVDFDGQAFDGPEKITVRLRPGHSSTAGT